MGAWGFTGRVLPGLLAALAATPAAASSRTVVVLGFDDGRISQLEALPILAAHGMRASFFLNSGRFGGSNHVSPEQARQLLAAGHEIGGHTRTHEDLVALSPREAREQVCDDRQRLLAEGLGPLESFAYPYASSDREAAAIVWSCGYRWGRSQGGLDEEDCSRDCVYAETFPPQHPLELRAPHSAKYSWTLADLQGHVLRAEASGGGLVAFAFHELCDDCSDTYRTSPALFGEFVDWLATREARGTVVRTLAEAMAEERRELQPPAVRLTTPAPDARVSGQVELGATASDDDQVAAVAFLVDGARVASLAGPPWAATWSTLFHPSPRAVVTAVALDRSGNQAVSAPVTLSVEGANLPLPSLRREPVDPPRRRAGPFRPGADSGGPADLSVDESPGCTAAGAAPAGLGLIVALLRPGLPRRRR